MDHRVEECLKRLEESDVVGIDVETSGLSWHDNFICGYVFTFGPTESDTYYLPVRHAGGGNIEGAKVPASSTGFYRSEHTHPIESRLKTILEGKRRTYYAHNAKFDMHMLASHDIWLKGEFEDTAVAAALINENQGKYDLDTCCKIAGVESKETEVYQYISDQMKAKHGVEIPANKRSMAYFWMMPATGKARDYAIADGTSMFQLREYQKKQIEEQELDRVWRLEKRVTRTLFRMERRGVPVDEEVLSKVEDKVHKMLDEARDAFPEGFNVRSPVQMEKLFLDKGFTRDDFVLTEKTKKPSFTEDWLENHGGELGQHIITARKYSNLINTFINGAIKSNLEDGRVHANFNQTKSDEYGVVTGRLSCSSPNFQQIPKRHKVLSPTLRQVFREKGLLWWSSDYSQQEYRVFAEYARSKFVLSAYDENPDTDYHQLVADLLGVERDPSAKRINLGVIYNMGAPSLARNLGVDVPTARIYLAKMRRMMPEASKFNKTAQKVAERRGYVKTILGRRRRFPHGEFAHKAGNAVIQGSSADITKQKMADCDEFLMGSAFDDLNIGNSDSKSMLILQIHDSLDFLFVEEERGKMEECMKIMKAFGPEDEISLKVPMSVDADIGISWGHATFPKYEDWVQ